MPRIVYAEAIFAQDVRQEIGKYSLMGIAEGGININPNSPLFISKLVVQIGLLVSFNIESGFNYFPNIEIVSSNGERSFYVIPWPPPANDMIQRSHYPTRIGFNIVLTEFGVSEYGTIVVNLCVDGNNICIGSLQCWPSPSVS